jgi:hypothetical protein
MQAPAPRPLSFEGRFRGHLRMRSTGKLARSRDACAPEFCESPWQERTSNLEYLLRFGSEPSRFEAQIKGSRTPAGAYFSKPPHHRRQVYAVCANYPLRVRLASSGTRSPDGVPLRHLRQRPNATTQLQHVLPGTRLKSGRYPPPPVPVQRVHPQTGRDAGRTFSPKPPGSKGDEPPPAGTALAPPDGVTVWRPVEERDNPILINNRDICQYIVAARAT